MEQHKNLESSERDQYYIRRRTRYPNLIDIHTYRIITIKVDIGWIEASQKSISETQTSEKTNEKEHKNRNTNCDAIDFFAYGMMILRYI